MFYNNQDKTKQDNYKRMLGIIGSLSRLFNDDKNPYIVYRAHENCFCRYFDAENLSRKDVSADAKIGNLGIGLKTWTGNDDQKVAEFGKLRPQYAHLRGLELVKKIAYYRNERIRFTMNTYGIERMIYHIAKRIPGKIQILECDFDYIDIDNIRLLDNRGNENNTYFTDGKNTYHFSSSKNTLYMLFDSANILDEFDVNIISDPYDELEKLFSGKVEDKAFTFLFPLQEDSGDILLPNQICLRLYSSTGDLKIVHEKSGLNIWNAAGRPRNPNEVYIPYPKEDRVRNVGFFPDKDISFDLCLPSGKHISAKICQEDGKAIMSNPNSDLGEWILRDVLGLQERELLTYDKLKIFGIDSVIFTKVSDLFYKIDFAPIGSYEKYYYGIEEMED